MATILPAGDSGTFLLLPRNRKREWAKIKIRAKVLYTHISITEGQAICFRPFHMRLPIRIRLSGHRKGSIFNI